MCIFIANIPKYTYSSLETLPQPSLVDKADDFLKI
jgi:hypothetical protein